jgi:RNA polymerase sigma-70 factor (ECF subfamily)
LRYNAFMPPSNCVTNHGSLILAARDSAEPVAGNALASLCALYWLPLYAYLRRRGHSGDNALGSTQDLIGRLLEKDVLGNVDPTRGKFRSYLLAVCNHFLANQRDRAAARKRGGGKAVLLLDAGDAEERYVVEAAADLTAEKLFERRWVLAVLQQGMARLRAEFEAKAKGRVFEQSRGFLVGEKGPATARRVKNCACPNPRSRFRYTGCESGIAKCCTRRSAAPWRRRRRLRRRCGRCSRPWRERNASRAVTFLGVCFCNWHATSGPVGCEPTGRATTMEVRSVWLFGLACIVFVVMLVVAGMAGVVILLVRRQPRRRIPQLERADPPVAPTRHVGRPTALRQCPECGADRSLDAPEGLCPQCLLKGAAAGHTTPSHPTPPVAPEPTRGRRRRRSKCWHRSSRSWKSWS